MASIPAHPGVVIESDETVWDGRFPLHRVKFRQQRLDGSMSGLRTWELWRRGRAAAVLPYDPATDQVVLLEQFRLPALAAGLDAMVVEVPAGLCDGAETPEVTARREIREEIGLEAGLLEPIGEFLLTPGGADERCMLYAGRVTAPAARADGTFGSGGLASENEETRILVQPAADAIAAALDGRYPNSVTTIALLWLAARRDWLRSRWTLP